MKGCGGVGGGEEIKFERSSEEIVMNYDTTITSS